MKFSLKQFIVFVTFVALLIAVASYAFTRNKVVEELTSLKLKLAEQERIAAEEQAQASKWDFVAPDESIRIRWHSEFNKNLREWKFYDTYATEFQGSNLDFGIRIGDEPIDWNLDVSLASVEWMANQAAAGPVNYKFVVSKKTDLELKKINQEFQLKFNVRARWQPTKEGVRYGAGTGAIFDRNVPYVFDREGGSLQTGQGNLSMLYNPTSVAPPYSFFRISTVKGKRAVELLVRSIGSDDDDSAKQD